MSPEVLSLSIMVAGVAKYVSDIRRLEKSTLSFSAALDNVQNAHVSASNAVAAHQSELSSRIDKHSKAGATLAGFNAEAASASQSTQANSKALLDKQTELANAKMARKQIQADWNNAVAANSVAWAAGGRSKTDPAAMATRARRDSLAAQKLAQDNIIKGLRAELLLNEQLLAVAKANETLINKKVGGQTRIVADAEEAIVAQKLLLKESVKHEAFLKSTRGRTESFLASYGLSLKVVQGFLIAGAVAGTAAIYSSAYKAALEMDSFKKKLSNIFSGENGGENAMKWVREYALTGKATIAELTQALVTLGRLGVQPTEKLIEQMNNVAILSGRNMGNIAQGIAFALKGSWWMMQRGLGIRKDDVMKLAPKAFDAKGKVVDRDAALAGIEKVMSGAQYQGAAERMAKGMTGISRQITAYVKDTLATIGEIPKESVGRILTSLLEVTKSTLPIITGMLTGLSKGLKLFLDGLSNLIPVFKVVTFFTGIWLTQLGINGLVNVIEGVSSGAIPLISNFKKLETVQKLVSFSTAIMNAAMNPAYLLTFGLAVAAVTAIFSYAYVKNMENMTKESNAVKGTLGVIKSATNDALTSLDYMYNRLYHKSKETLDNIKAYFDEIQDKFDVAISAAEALGNSQASINHLKYAQGVSILTEYKDVMEKIAIAEKVKKDGGYSLTESDMQNELKSNMASVRKGEELVARHKKEWEDSVRARESNIRNSSGNSMSVPIGDAEMQKRQLQAHKDYLAEVTALATSKTKLDTAKSTLIDTNNKQNATDLKELDKERLELLTKMSKIIHRNNEKVHQEILGGGDLGRLGIAKYAIWKKFGDKFKSQDTGIKISIKIDNAMDSALREFATGMARQVADPILAAVASNFFQN